MRFMMVWKSTGEPVTYDDPMEQLRFPGFRATCQLAAQVSVPSIGFAWKWEALETSQADFTIVGNEINGKYDPKEDGGRGSAIELAE